MFLVLSKQSVFFSSIKRRRVYPGELGETPRREPPKEAASTTGSRSTERSARYRHQSQRIMALSRRVEAAKKGTPQNVGFDTPFLTGERVQSVKMNFSIEKTGNDISGDDHCYSEEEIQKWCGCVKLGSGCLCSSNSRRAWRR